MGALMTVIFSFKCEVVRISVPGCALIVARNPLTGDFMHDYWRNPSSVSHRASGTAGVILLAVHGVLLLVLAGVVLCSPRAGGWISETVQAEFVGGEPPVMAPTQFAQPVGDMWAASTH
jgi:hypothetical protein